MKALGRKIVIKPDEKEEVTSTGIIKYTVTNDKFAQGTVVSVGADTKEVRVGDHVLYSALLFDEVKYKDEEFHVVDESDIFAIAP